MTPPNWSKRIRWLVPFSEDMRNSITIKLKLKNWSNWEDNAQELKIISCWSWSGFPKNTSLLQYYRSITSSFNELSIDVGHSSSCWSALDCYFPLSAFIKFCELVVTTEIFKLWYTKFIARETQFNLCSCDQKAVDFQSKHVDIWGCNLCLLFFRKDKHKNHFC